MEGHCRRDKETRTQIVEEMRTMQIEIMDRIAYSVVSITQGLSFSSVCRCALC